MKSENASTSAVFPPKIKLEFVDTDAIYDENALFIEKKRPHEAMKVDALEWPTIVDYSIVKKNEDESEELDFQFDLNDEEYFEIVGKLRGTDADLIEIVGISQMCPQEGCKKLFKTKRELTRHLKRHVDSFCDKCGFTFKGSVSTHLKKHDIKTFQKVQRGSDEGLELMKCDICSKEFSKSAIFKQHLKMVHMNKGLDCQWCFKTLRCEKSLEGHMALHTDVKDFICELCGREFSTERLLTDHGPSHETNHPYKCKICFMSFTCAQTISRHKRIHGPPILCIVCPQSFSYDSHMRRHLKLSHSDVDGIKIPRSIPPRRKFGKERKPTKNRKKNGIEAAEGS